MLPTVDLGLELRGITHAFGERRVLDDVDPGVPAGEVIGLLGPDGAVRSKRDVDAPARVATRRNRMMQTRGGPTVRTPS